MAHREVVRLLIEAECSVLHISEDDAGRGLAARATDASHGERPQAVALLHAVAAPPARKKVRLSKEYVVRNE